MSDSEEPRTLIGYRTAMMIYGVLVVIAFVTLKRTALYLTLLILGALAVKTYIHHVRSHLE